MAPEEILALYDWRSGTCFRHPNLGRVETAHVKTLHPRTGEGLDIRACKGCVLKLEGERQRAAEQSGGRYRPGRLGRSA